MAKNGLLTAWRRRRSDCAGIHVSAHGMAVVRLSAQSPHKVHSWQLHAGDDAAAALATAVKQLHLRRADCTLTLAFGHYQLLQVEKPNVAEPELLPALRWRVRDMLGFALEEAVVDAFEVPGIESRGKPPSMYVVAARRGDLAGRVESLRDAGLRPRCINVGEMALRRLVALAASEQESIAVLCLGRGTGCLCIVREQTVFVSRKIELDAAEVRALDQGQLADEGRERLFERLALEIQRTLDYFDSTYQRPPVRRLLLLPDVDGLQDLPESLRRNLGVDAAELDLAGLFGIEALQRPGHAATLALAAAGAIDAGAP